MNQSRHICITGGAGFIGSHLVKRFLAEGYKVTVVDNFVTGSRHNIKSYLDKDSDRFQLIEADLGQFEKNPIDPEKVKGLRFFSTDGLAGVLHFACPASPVDFDKIPIEILGVDSAGTHYTVKLARHFGARFMVASTSEIYGDPLEHPQKETYFGNVNTLGPRSCYDETKRFAEAYVSTSMRLHGLDAVIVRIFNTYGPNMRLDDGRVVPELCKCVLENRPMTVHGDGRQTRSFCFVDDLVEGIYLAFKSGKNDVFNLGNPVEYSILEFAEALDRITQAASNSTLNSTPNSASNSAPQAKLKLNHLPAREDDPKRRKPDITKARKILGWEPKVPLEDGLRKTFEYFRSVH